MAQESNDPGFAPADTTDGRSPGDWTSRYQDATAKTWIRIEAGFLLFHLLAIVVAVFWIAFNHATTTAPNIEGLPNPGHPAQGSSDADWLPLLHAWLGGVLGGTIFAIKWLYHVVAKNLWHVDRRLWRLFTPHLSGALSLAFVIMLSSGILVIIDPAELKSKWVCFTLGFLVGYFSDNATAKMSEVAKTVFGATQREPDKS